MKCKIFFIYKLAFLTLLIPLPLIANSFIDEIKNNSMVVQLEQAIRNYDHQVQPEIIEQIRNMDEPAASNELLYFEAKEANEVGDFDLALYLVKRYISNAGNDGLNYQAAQELLLKIPESTSLANHPCDDAMELSLRAKPNRKMSILGSCLATPGPSDTLFLVAGEMLRISMEKNDKLACNYARIVKMMSESPHHELDPDTVAKIINRADKQACYCDRQWSQERLKSDDPQKPAPSWFGWGNTPQSLLSYHSENISEIKHELFVNTRQSMNHVCVFSNGELRHAESRSSVTTGFERGEFTALGVKRNPTIVLVWRTGDQSGESIQIIDLQKTNFYLEK